MEKSGLIDRGNAVSHITLVSYKPATLSKNHYTRNTCKNAHKHCRWIFLAQSIQRLGQLTKVMPVPATRHGKSKHVRYCLVQQRLPGVKLMSMYMLNYFQSGKNLLTHLHVHWQLLTVYIVSNSVL